MRVGYAIFTVATLSFLGAGVQTGRRPTGDSPIAETYHLIPADTGGRRCSRPLAIASW